YGAAAAQAERAGLKGAQVHALICAMYPLGFFDPGAGIAAMDEAVQAGRRVGDPLGLAPAPMLAASCRLVFEAWRPEDADLCRAAHDTLRQMGELGSDLYQQVCYAHVLILQGKHQDAMQILEASVPRMDLGVRLIAHFGALSGKTL